MDTLGRVHLRGLRAVEAVGRFGTLAKAAEHLGVSIGAVSQQVLKTERQLGRTLFHRTPRGLEPTEFGREILPALRDGFRLLADAVALARPEPDGDLALSVAPVFAAKWLVPRLAGFTASRPELALRLDATIALADLDGGAVDVAVRVGTGEWPGVRATKLVDQIVFPVCAPALAAALTAPAMLAAHPIIRDHGSMVSWRTWLDSVGCDETILTRGPVYSDASLALDAVAAGQGVMLAWQTLAEDALDQGRVVAPFPQAVRTGLAYWFVRSGSRPPRPVETAFRDWLSREMRPLEPDVFAARLGARRPGSSGRSASAP